MLDVANWYIQNVVTETTKLQQLEKQSLHFRVIQEQTII